MASVEQQIEWLQGNITELSETKASLDDSQQLWILTCGFLVFWMHAGFAMLEAGAVRVKNTVNILFKNIMTVSIGGIAYFIFGYGFAYGENNLDKGSTSFIGNGDYFLRGVDPEDFGVLHFWYFQMVFAMTCATIVSGAVAERTKLEAYFIVAFFLCSFTYPIVSHWIWSGSGWLSAFSDPADRLFYSDDKPHVCGMIDFAGSAVVHLVGGTAGLVGAIVVGPRIGRFEQLSDGKLGKALPLTGHNMALSSIGTFILWFGWFGFNAGSTLALAGDLASLVAINTTLSPAAASVVGIIVNKFFTKSWDLGVALNCVLAGLVSITAGCSVIKPWQSLFVGGIGAIIYLACSALLKKLHIDDPLDAVPVHGACGIWGCLAIGIFASPAYIANSYDCPDAMGNTDGTQFLTQLVGVICVILWVVANASIIFLTLKFTMGVRVHEEDEIQGLDSSEHGAVAYEVPAKEVLDIEDPETKEKSPSTAAVAEVTIEQA